MQTRINVQSYTLLKMHTIHSTNSAYFDSLSEESEALPADPVLIRGFLLVNF